jgi:hypothetical protein
MSMVLDDPRIEALAQELARRQGVTPVEAVARALQAQLGPTSKEQAADDLRALRDEIARAFPAGAAPIPWETVKRWARDDDGGDTA